MRTTDLADERHSKIRRRLHTPTVADAREMEDNDVNRPDGHDASPLDGDVARRDVGRQRGLDLAVPSVEKTARGDRGDKSAEPIRKVAESDDGLAEAIDSLEGCGAGVSQSRPAAMFCLMSRTS